MTVEQARQKLLTWATGLLGYHEGADNYNKFADDPRLHQRYIRSIVFS